MENICPRMGEILLQEYLPFGRYGVASVFVSDWTEIKEVRHKVKKR